MAAPAVNHAPAAASTAAAVARTGLVGRSRAGVAALGAAVLGAAPHVLHHVGPLAGAALLAGATGKLLFGALGFVLTIPMLRRLRRRTGSWRVPGGALAAMAVIFTFSSFVISPALAGGGEAERESAAPSQTLPAAPPGVSDSEHESHHR
ncbi:MAG TPA: hypothetical protein VFY91_16400 [Microbacterium sp.]|nr:hypothetical protein [Microbacterium sp.]